MENWFTFCFLMKSYVFYILKVIYIKEVISPCNNSEFISACHKGFGCYYILHDWYRGPAHSIQMCNSLRLVGCHCQNYLPWRTVVAPSKRCKWLRSISCTFVAWLKLSSLGTAVVDIRLAGNLNKLVICFSQIWI